MTIKWLILNIQQIENQLFYKTRQLWRPAEITSAGYFWNMKVNQKLLHDLWERKTTVSLAMTGATNSKKKKKSEWIHQSQSAKSTAHSIEKKEERERKWQKIISRTQIWVPLFFLPSNSSQKHEQQIILNALFIYLYMPVFYRI